MNVLVLAFLGGVFGAIVVRPLRDLIAGFVEGIFERAHDQGRHEIGAHPIICPKCYDDAHER